MRFLFLESFFGGSHKDFAEGLIAHSRHRIDLVSMPPRHWKWRMRGAALHFVRRMPSLRPYDGLIVTDLLGLSDLKALLGSGCPPVLVYFHENQLTYPVAPGERMDFHLGFTNITTALTAERVLFNSKSHCQSFFSALPGFLNMLPDYRPRWVVESLRKKTAVIYPGCQFPASKKRGVFRNVCPPLIIWNHRWEHDKDPGTFFQVLDAVLAQGAEFRLALLGESFRRKPPEFAEARERYGDRVVQCGFVDEKKAYYDWLSQGSIVISTSRQENFGISVVEAIRHGCFPLLPNRLVYPEILPEAFHGDCLYEDSAALVEKLVVALTRHADLRDKIEALSDAMGRYAWDRLVAAYDSELEGLPKRSSEPG